MLSMSLGCCQHQVLAHRQTIRQCHRLQLSQEQKQEQRLSQRLDQFSFEEKYYEYFLNFVNTAHGLSILPMATCPKCDYQLLIGEIILGFKTDVTDLTTGCPRCKTRFHATNLVNTSTGTEIPFFCPAQVLNQMTGMEVLEANVIRVKYPDIYETAIFHFGSLLNAFSRKNIDYRREHLDWTTKARSLLGQVPDRDIATVFGVKIHDVKAKRIELNIDRFSGRRTIIPADWKPFDN